ncbi:AAA family ATPase [Mammaliicoccus sciuri]|uniref:ATP-dependent nuclease n=1 Tax=Mammaliicoccus sciuri TaxID=1296 RepID=UPI001330AF2C|nr:AAA family ATPase [Mammaliicoccus sciuri]MCJ1749543.1 AAA family ATPase [Mammaliicoccus sciuri]
MYLHSLKLWNWRKFAEKDNDEPGIQIEFKEGLNILVGENDSGKTAIIDAIKMILGTNSNDKNWITEQDFYEESTSLKVECIFRNLSEEEEAFFYEWLTIKSEKSELRIFLEAEIYEDINKQRKIKRNIKAGTKGLEMGMDDSVRHLLAVTYLKPLRDATIEMSSGNRSRIAQIIKSLKDFSNDSIPKKKVVDSFTHAFDELKEVLNDPVLSKIGCTIDEFFEENSKKIPQIRNKEMSFQEILRKLELNIGEEGIGLGSSNLLFMAAELLLLNETEVGPKIALIEEIEAHIHPQAQLRVIKHFEKDVEDTNIQYIFTSHSPILAASVSLENIIFIYDCKAFPMKKGHTKLKNDDYEFLERFLDATKANLFFARGVIFVEGDAENLILPAIAEVINRPLYKYGVSIINVGSLAFKRYSSIFIRNNNEMKMNFPVSIITDLDLKPVNYYKGEICYFKITSEHNLQIAELYDNQKVEPEMIENIYIQNTNLISKSKTVYGKEIKEKYLGLDRKRKFEEISKKIPEIVEKSDVYFDDKKEEEKKKLENKFYHNIEGTKVFISQPWTLEHSIATSFLMECLENILLEVHYSDETNRKTVKNEWKNISNKEERATAIYSFLLDKKVSKAIVAQKLAEYLLHNKEDIRGNILEDEALQHLVDAIKHVTGGEEKIV